MRRERASDDRLQTIPKPAETARAKLPGLRRIPRRGSQRPHGAAEQVRVGRQCSPDAMRGVLPGMRGEKSMTDKLLTVEQVAAWFGISTGWVRDHASGRFKPVLPIRKLGTHCLRFRASECAEFLGKYLKPRVVA